MCYIAQVKQNVSRSSLQGFNNRFITFWIIEVTWTSLAQWLAHPICIDAVWDCFLREEVSNLIFHFEGSNEGIVGREAEMRSSMVECGEKPLEGGEWGVC